MRPVFANNIGLLSFSVLLNKWRKSISEMLLNAVIPTATDCCVCVGGDQSSKWMRCQYIPITPNQVRRRRLNSYINGNKLITCIKRFVSKHISKHQVHVTYIKPVLYTRRFWPLVQLIFNYIIQKLEAT